MANFRMDRINKQLQRELALILEKNIKKNSVKDAIITGVECSSDLEKARVFFTTVKANAAKRKHLKGELQSIKGVLRSLLGQAVRLRRVPDLEFIPGMGRNGSVGERALFYALGSLFHFAKDLKGIL